jgi:hypothetical protein
MEHIKENRMIKSVKRYIKRNPYQAGLIAYNVGVFAWLQTNAITLLGKHNVTIPPFLQSFSAEALRFISNYTPISWLIGSMLLAWVFKAVDTVVKWIITIALVFVAYYLLKSYGIAIFG